MVTIYICIESSDTLFLTAKTRWLFHVAKEGRLWIALDDDWCRGNSLALKHIILSRTFHSKKQTFIPVLPRDNIDSERKMQSSPSILSFHHLAPLLVYAVQVNDPSILPSMFESLV